MNLEELNEKAKYLFPKVKIKYKDESILMKILGTLLFFNKSFMKSYTTTIGNTIYFPSKQIVDQSPISYSTVYLHELVHVYDAQKYSIFFSLLYLVPQLLVLVFLLLAFFLSWKLIFVALLFLAPLPAYFRMRFEKRAYTISMYARNKILQKLGRYPALHDQADSISEQFTGPAYMYMWPFKGIKKYFNSVADDIESGKRPDFVEPEVYNIIDKILED